MKNFNSKEQYLTYLINQAVYIYGHDSTNISRFLLANGVNIYIGKKAKSIIQKESKSNEH